MKYLELETIDMKNDTETGMAMPFKNSEFKEFATKLLGITPEQFDKLKNDSYKNPQKMDWHGDTWYYFHLVPVNRYAAIKFATNHSGIVFRGEVLEERRYYRQTMPDYDPSVVNIYIDYTVKTWDPKTRNIIQKIVTRSVGNTYKNGHGDKYFSYLRDIPEHYKNENLRAADRTDVWEENGKYLGDCKRIYKFNTEYTAEETLFIGFDPNRGISMFNRTDNNPFGEWIKLSKGEKFTIIKYGDSYLHGCTAVLVKIIN